MPRTRVYSRGSCRLPPVLNCRCRALRKDRAPPANSSCSQSLFPPTPHAISRLRPRSVPPELSRLCQLEAVIPVGGDLVALPAVTANAFGIEIGQKCTWLARDVGSHVPGVRRWKQRG